MLGYIIGTVATLLIIGLIWGVIHLRQSQRVAAEAIAGVGIDQIPALREECQRVFQQAFGQTLSLDRLESSAQLLSDRLDDVETLKRAFAKPGFYWYFVLPVGAYLGELMRAHAHGEWRQSDEGGVEMRVPVAGDFATTYPFDKVLKHASIGGKGDILAYLMSATRLDEVLAGAES